jgi:hypothetical protein
MISLFSTFFLAKDKHRLNELLFCLNRNSDNNLIKNIFLLIEKQNFIKVKEFLTKTINLTKFILIEVEDIPTCGDWIIHSKSNIDKLADYVAFANTDIYFDDSLTKLNEWKSSCNGLICLTRYEEVESERFTAATNPHWTQDCWIMSKKSLKSITNKIFIKELQTVPFGIPRCDNKIPYLFAMRGWDIFNPLALIRTYHKHKSLNRSYDKLEQEIVGSTAFVAPTDDINTPSRLAVVIFATKNNVSCCNLNDYLYNEKYKKKNL